MEKSVLGNIIIEVGDPGKGAEGNEQSGAKNDGGAQETQPDVAGYRQRNW